MNLLTAFFVRNVALAMVAWILAGSMPAQHWQKVPPPRPGSGHTLAYDLARGRTVMFGGWVPDGGACLLNDTWEYDGARGKWSNVSTSVAPSPRADGAMACDVARGLTVLFGGLGQLPAGGWSDLNDTWEYDGSTWTQIATSVSPPARREHVMAYDIVRGRIVLFGGGALNDTWEYDGSTWTQIATGISPPARYRHGMAYDIVRDRTVLFGGQGLNDTWEYDGASSNWVQVATALAPAQGSGGSLAYDLARQCHVFCAGNETWEYYGATRTWVQVTSLPAAAAGHTAMAYDVARGRTLLFSNDIWEYDGLTATWTQVTTRVSPRARSNHAMAYDAARGRSVLYGGGYAMVLPPLFSYWVLLGDTWEFDAGRDTWTEVTTADSPSPRIGHGMATDASRGRTVLFGGATLVSPMGPFNQFNDTWEYDGTNWTAVACPVSPPARAEHAMVYDSWRSRVVLFGGSDGTSLLVDTWEYDGTTWARNLTPATPPARAGHAMAFDASRGRTVLFGGSGGTSLLVDTWEYDGANWTRVAVANAPSAWAGYAMAYDTSRGRTLLYGNDETWEYDGATWTQVAVPTPLVAYYGLHRGFAMNHDVLHGRTVVFGGRWYWPPPTQPMIHIPEFDDTWEFVPAAVPTWTVYGTGCPGSGGTPGLSAGSSVPALGTTLNLTVTSLPASAGFVLLASGFHLGQTLGRPLPMELTPFRMPGCRLWVDPAAVAGLAHGGGQVTFSFAIPNQPALAGVAFASQALSLDLAAGNGFGAVSNAGIATLW